MMRTSKLGRLVIRGAVVAAAGFAALSVAGPAVASDDGSGTSAEIVPAVSADADEVEAAEEADGDAQVTTLGLEWA